MSDPLADALAVWEREGKLSAGMRFTYSGPGLGIVKRIHDPSVVLGEGYLDVVVEDTYFRDYGYPGAVLTTTVPKTRESA